MKAATESASVETPEAGLPTGGIASRNTAMTEPAERAGTRTGHRVRIAGTAKRRGTVEVGSRRMEIVPIDDRPALRDVGIVVVNHPSGTVPVEAPMVPAPTETAKEAYSETEPKSDSWASQEEAGIRIPTREDGQGITVH